MTTKKKFRAVDLFAGWGGLTLGAEFAGVEVVWAANHWELAVRAHALNHPRTTHVCQDLRQADWTSLPRYDLLLAAPACQGHSEASQPKRRIYHDALRATAWAVIDCAEVTRPRAILVENVPAFLRWKLFPLWRQALVELGYHVGEHVVLASHHGVPQRRERLFVMATRRPVSVAFDRGPEPGFGPCIEWGEGDWRPVTRASKGAQIRIGAARARLGIRRFLSQHVTGHRGVSLDEPIRTITTKDQWIVVDGDKYRPLLLREYARGMSFPDSYRWPSEISRVDTIRGLGNAVPPLLGKKMVETLAEVA